MPPALPLPSDVSKSFTQVQMPVSTSHSPRFAHGSLSFVPLTLKATRMEAPSERALASCTSTSFCGP
jgi:hypothetical protein